MSASDAPRPFLLHSLTTFWHHIEGCLNAVGPAHVLEIGSEGGGTTARLAAWCAAHDAVLTSVDPDPAPATLELAEREPALRVLAGASPAGLDGLEPAQVWIIDGDHNYWTVRRELEAGLAQDEPPLVVLHDVGWPAGRRDQYYAPAGLPAEGLRPHRVGGGVRPGEPGLVEGGFRGDFAFAEREGGPANGVRTAIEDVMAEHEDLVLHVLPAVFGLGVLHARSARWAGLITALLGPHHEDPLLAALEENRLDLFLRVLDLQDEMELRRGRADAEIARLQRRLEAAEAALLAGGAGQGAG